LQLKTKKKEPRKLPGLFSHMTQIVVRVDPSESVKYPESAVEACTRTANQPI